MESNRCIQFLGDLSRTFTRKKNKLQKLYSWTIHTIKKFIIYRLKSYIVKYHVNLHPLLCTFHSTCFMEDDEFLGALQNFISTFEDNSRKISFDEFNENSDDDEMMTAMEDSDSSNEEWSDVNNVTTMNISLDHKTGMFHIALDKQCIVSSSTLPKQTEESEQKNFFHDKGNDHSFSDFSITCQLKQDRIKEPKIKFTVNIKKRKIISHQDKTKSHIGHKNESKIQEGKRSYPRIVSTKSQSSKTSKKKLQRKNIQYKKTTQTDNYSSDDEIEVILIKAKRERKLRTRSRLDLEICQFQRKNTNEELNCMADNEDPIDGFSQIKHRRIFLRSSSINSGFENRASNMKAIVKQWSTISPDHTNSFPTRSCASPDFQELRQNPLSYVFYPQCMLSLNDNPNFFPLRRITIIPPAISPMRHLYYEYPEFMAVPLCTDLSKTSNI